MERELDQEQKRFHRVIELAPAKETVSMNNVVPCTQFLNHSDNLVGRCRSLIQLVGRSVGRPMGWLDCHLVPQSLSELISQSLSPSVNPSGRQSNSPSVSKSVSQSASSSIRQPVN